MLASITTTSAPIVAVLVGSLGCLRGFAYHQRAEAAKFGYSDASASARASSIEMFYGLHCHGSLGPFSGIPVSLAVVVAVIVMAALFCCTRWKTNTGRFAVLFHCCQRRSSREALQNSAVEAATSKLRERILELDGRMMSIESSEWKLLEGKAPQGWDALSRCVSSCSSMDMESSSRLKESLEKCSLDLNDMVAKRDARRFQSLRSNLLRQRESHEERYRSCERKIQRLEMSVSEASRQLDKLNAGKKQISKADEVNDENRPVAKACSMTEVEKCGLDKIIQMQLASLGA
eukprot:CAMPEP_0170605616 /NCGR_PEP_ID=MMETSP0224-20130122/20066_1 /TAXON_ID=285029 /ORGANISM="Togula jolla, Strain CCCM 725" /LENGTH=289 /DNA_ID=CAMNT_0010930627 /DNA_START=22 /DNA_END=891 /DNA_ORIENTATION=-